MWIGVLWAGLRVAMWITHVGGKFHHGLLEKFNAEYDRAKVPPYNGNDPPPAPGSLKAPLFPPLLNKGNARGTSEVRRGTSSIHFHCPVPRSSSHSGHGKITDF